MFLISQSVVTFTAELSPKVVLDFWQATVKISVTDVCSRILKVFWAISE